MSLTARPILYSMLCFAPKRKTTNNPCSSREKNKFSGRFPCPQGESFCLEKAAKAQLGRRSKPNRDREPPTVSKKLEFTLCYFFDDFLIILS